MTRVQRLVLAGVREIMEPAGWTVTLIDSGTHQRLELKKGDKTRILPFSRTTKQRPENIRNFMCQNARRVLKEMAA